MKTYVDIILIVVLTIIFLVLVLVPVNYSNNWGQMHIGVLNMPVRYYVYTPIFLYIGLKLLFTDFSK